MVGLSPVEAWVGEHLGIEPAVGGPVDVLEEYSPEPGGDFVAGTVVPEDDRGWFRRRGGECKGQCGPLYLAMQECWTMQESALQADLSRGR